jgi:hypothetical protein
MPSSTNPSALFNDQRQEIELLSFFSQECPWRQKIELLFFSSQECP